MKIGKKWVLLKHYKGKPTRDVYEIVEFTIPPLKNGEILVKSEWIAVDLYLQQLNKSYPVPYDQFSTQVGAVLESKNPKFEVGAKIVSSFGWCTHYVVNPNEVSNNLFGGLYKVRKLAGLSETLALGYLGLPGITGYYGILEVCKPKAGETVVISGAAAPVGSIVGQIAKIKGCRVIGFAGSDDKVKYLEDELGFDKGINYKTADVAKALKKVAQSGVDVFFDNVGGQLSSHIIYQMNNFGRVAVCGSVDTFLDGFDAMPEATILQPALLAKKLTVRGFCTNEWIDKWPAGYSQILQWLKEGKLKPKDYVIEGFDNLFNALVDVISGENIGKTVVKV